MQRKTLVPVALWFFRIVSKLDKKEMTLRLLRKSSLLLSDAHDDRLNESGPNPSQLGDLAMASRLDSKKIHIVGNSHAHSFTGSKLGRFGKGDLEFKQWDSFSLGPLSTIDLLERKWNIFEKLITSNNFLPGDSILFPFGEAECRWYSLKKISPDVLKNYSEKQLSRLIEPFLEASFEIYRKTAELGFEPLVWSGHLSRAISPLEDPIMPVAGNENIRKSLAIMWRNASSTFSMENSLTFLDFLDFQLTMNDSQFRQTLEDEIHLNSNLVTAFLFARLQNTSWGGSTEIDPQFGLGNPK